MSFGKVIGFHGACDRIRGKLCHLFSRSNRKRGEATEADIAERMGVSLKEFQQMLADNNSSQMYSIDELQENYSDSWESNDGENAQLNPLNEAIQENLIANIAEHIRMIPKREQQILQFYYQQDLNMKEIGLILGVTETRVSQLHSLAIKRLRSRMDRLRKE